jgi:hypothetical protein
VPRWLKILLWLLVIAVAIVLLFTVVFPRVERILEDPTMGAGPAALLALAAAAWFAPG